MNTHARFHEPVTKRLQTTSQRLGHQDNRTFYMHWGQIWKLVFVGIAVLTAVYWLTT